MTIAARLWPKARIDKATGCWNWTACTNSSGYGNIGHNGKTVGAHRLAWELVNGSIPDGKFVLHHCDNRACINPVHLFLGGHLENARDRMRKGRSKGAAPAGERNGSAKLTEGCVVFIRQLYGKGWYSQREIAEMFGVTQTVIGDLIRRKTWRHVA